MALINWIGGFSTHFNDAQNWSPQVVPGVADDAVINVGAASVDTTASATVNSFSITATATLSIGAATTFGIANGTYGGGIAGLLKISDNATLQLGGTIVNSGTIQENSAGSNTRIILTQGLTRLQGGGQIQMSANASNQIYGSQASYTLENVNNTISGAGALGAGQMTLSNAGIINGNQAAAALTVNTGSNLIRNTGTMEATAGGKLVIASNMNNVGGTILSTGANSVVALQGVVSGGLITTNTGGVVQATSVSATLDSLPLHTVTINGTIQVLNAQALSLLGTIINNGVLNPVSTGNSTDLRIASPIVTLQGTGAVHLGDNPNNRILSTINAGFQLVNKTNTIDGAGQLGGGSLSFTNNSTVTANLANALVLNTGNNTVINTGTLQATGTGGLLIQSAVKNVGGTVQAIGAGAHVDLGGGSIMGGNLISGPGAVVNVASGDGGLDGLTFGSILNRATVVVSDQRSLYLSGVIANQGTLYANQVSNTGYSSIRLASQTVTLSGGGKLVMSNNFNNRIYGNSGYYTLINLNNTISGSGQLGFGQMTLVNQAGGLISADAAASQGSSGQLLVNTTNSILTNAGIMQATNTGGLMIQNTIVKNTGGIKAINAGSTVYLDNSTVQGGQLVASAGAGIATTTNNAALDGINNGALSIVGQVNVTSQSRLDVAGTINNAGTILLNQLGATGTTNLQITSQQVVLQGNGFGKVVMSNNGSNRIYGANSNVQLVNVNNVISGAGQIGVNSLSLVNQALGRIVADQTTALVINTGGNVLRNAGIMQATGTGGLVLSSSVIDNAGGTIQALGAGAHVDLSSAWVEGGTLTTSGVGAVIRSTDASSVLDGITSGVLTNQGVVQVQNATSLKLVGTINNTGTIALASVGANANLIVSGQTAVLQGGGQVVLSDVANNRIYGSSGYYDLINVNNVISGAGQLGVGGLTLINQANGVINANQSNALIVNTGAYIATNSGLMESTSAVVGNGGLVIQNMTLNNAGGTILAAGAQAHVNLDGAYIEGGTLATSGGGIIATIGNAALDGLTSTPLLNTGVVVVNDHTRLDLVGSIVNSGTIRSNATSVSGNTDIRLIGWTTTLSGAGQLQLSDNATNRIYGASSNYTLVNQGNVISGAGQFGANTMNFVNAAGTIQATGTNALVIGLNGGTGVNAAGAFMNANGSGGMIISSGIITNNGVMTVNNGSALTYQAGVINTNLAEGDLIGGIWRAFSSGAGATLSMTGGPIVNNQAILILSGANSIIRAGTGSGGTPYTNLESSLRSVVAGGQLRVQGNRGYTSSLDLLDTGLIQLAGGTFQVGTLTLGATGVLAGTGVVDEAPINNGKIQAQGGLLTVTGNITGTGSLLIDNASTLELGGIVSEVVNFTTGAVGTLKLDIATNFYGTITGLALGDVIDLADIAPASVTGVSMAADKVIVSYTGHPDLVYAVAGPGINPAVNKFVAAADGAGGTKLTLTAGAAVAGSGTLPTPPGGGGGGGFPPVNKTWIGGFGNSFNTVSNWSPVGVPTATDYAVIGAGFSVVASVVNTVKLLDLGAGSSLNISATNFTITDGTGAGGIAATGTIAYSNANLFLGGTIANAGLIAPTSTGNTNTDLRLSKNTVLTGGGRIVLSNDTYTRIYANNGSYLLDNVSNTISGTGLLGVGLMSLTNEAGGIVNANVLGKALTVNTGGNALTNAGTMQATLGGTLYLQSAMTNIGGVITAVGAGSVVNLQASVIGGTVTASTGGVVQAIGNTAALDGLGLHPVTLSTALQVNDAQSLTLLGGINNNGTIALKSTGGFTDLRLNSAIVTLRTGGTIAMSNNANNRIFGNSSNYQLVNVNNKIIGAGQLGSGQMTFSNAGLVDANQTTALVLNTNGNVVTNTGTLQSTGTGGLAVQSTTINNAGGTIQALVAGAHVDLSASAIQGGSLKGFIRTTGDATLDGLAAGAITNNGTMQISDQTNLFVSGIINNLGTILLNQISLAGAARLRLASQIVTLQGGGRLVMSNSDSNQVYGQSASNTLINVNNIISGAGALGSGQMTLINQAAGVIKADQDATYFGTGQLVVNTASNLMTNAGTMMATATGGLRLYNTTIGNAGGTIAAFGADTHVDLDTAWILSGTLVTTGGGVIQVVSNAVLDGITNGPILNLGTVLVNDQTRLDLAGTINNVGSILLDQQSIGGATDLRLVAQNVVLQGGGQVLMSNNSLNRIYATDSTIQLVNVNNTIAGAGQLGANLALTLINQATGLINANQATALAVGTNGRLATNLGLMESTNTGGLLIYNTPINNAGGTILATGAGSHVDLATATIEGGVLSTALGGVINVIDRASTLDGLTVGAISNLGTIQINNAQMLRLAGTINNAATIVASAVGSVGKTDLRIDGQNVVLQGGGSILMSNNANNQIYGSNAKNQFVNVNNTIAGSGALGVGATMFMTNQAAGVINANQKTALVVNFGANIMTNAGRMEATSTVAANGGLVLVNTTINNTGGTIRAVGTLAHVDLVGATIEGGIVTTLTGGIIQTGLNSTSTLDGLTVGAITNTGTIRINETSKLQLVGAIANAGTILQSAFSLSGSYADLIAAGGGATLTGTGRLLLSDNANNRIYGSLLINQGNTISGAGLFGTGGGFGFVNTSGSIIATGTNALVFNLGASASGVNGPGATMSATGTGGLLLANGIYTNSGIMAVGDGSSLTYRYDAINTNLAEGVLSGGTWRVIAGANGATMLLTGGPLAVDAATIVLQGAGSVLRAGTGLGATPYTDIEQTLTSVAVGGQLQVLGGRNYISGLTIDDNGIIQLGGGTLQAAGLTIAAGASLFGFGTVVTPVTNAGTINAKPGTLTVNGNISGTGSLIADAASTLVLSGGSNSAGSVIDNGTVKLGGGALQATSLSVATAGAVLSGFGTITGPIANAGTVAANGGVLNVNSAVSGAGTLRADVGGTLFLKGATNTAASAQANGTLRLSGGTLQATAGTVAATGVLLGFGTVSNAIANAGKIQANGGTLAASGAVTGTGILQTDAAASLNLNGSTNTAASVINNGTVSIGASDTLTVTGSVAAASSGIFILNNAAVLEVAADTGNANRMSFIGSTSRLIVDAVASFGTNVGQASYTGPLLQNFGVGDAVDLKDLNFAGAVQTYTAATGLMQLTSGATLATLRFDNATVSGPGVFQLSDDGTGHVRVTHT
ncbi:MAG: hypothetical protein JSS43_27890 [Proteobacteria bacterium]|nr:hypothetical protein [Pseudomonadota bacterium]